MATFPTIHGRQGTTIPKPPLVIPRPAPLQGLQNTIPQPTVPTPTVKVPLFAPPVIQTPTVNQPVVQTPTVNQPVVQAPTVNQPVVQTPTVNQPVVQTPTFPRPIIQTPTVNPTIPQTPTVPRPVINTQQLIPQEPIGYQPGFGPQLGPGPPLRETRAPQKGGVMRQFGGKVTAPLGVPQPATAPNVTVITITAETLLSQLMHVWNGTIDQVQRLIALTYEDGKPIIDIKRRDVILEIVGMLVKNEFDEIFNFLANAPDVDYILWKQKSLDEGRARLAREIAIQQVEDTGTKGVGKCRYCPSTELVFSLRQNRSSDEAMTVFVRCVLCSKQWRQ